MTKELELVDKPTTVKEVFDGIEQRQLVNETPTAARRRRKLERKAAMVARENVISARHGLPYDARVALHICGLISQGFTMARIENEPGMPRRETIYKWLHTHPDFHEAYTIAQGIRAEAMGDECLEIADDSSKDIIERVTNKGTIVQAIDHENIHRSRLRVETRRHLMSKLSPKKYGDNLSINPSSGVKATLIIEG